MTVLATYLLRMEAFLQEVVDGKQVFTPLDITSFQCSFRLNEIPSAILGVAVGRSLADGRLANIQRVLSKLTSSAVVVVRARLIPSADTQQRSNMIPAMGIPPDGRPFTIFEGRLAGREFMKSSEDGQMQILLHLDHWLAQLSKSSVLSAESRPTNPANYTYGAISPGSQDGSRNWSGLTAATEFITDVIVMTDFWDSGLRPFFNVTLNDNTLQINEQNIVGSTSNKTGLAELNRFKKPGDTGYVRLGIGDDVSLEPEIVQALVEDVSLLSMMPQDLAQQTVWDVLVGSYAPQYLFAIVPRVLDAMVVPYVPTMKHVGATIAAGTYTTIRPTMSLSRRLRAVGILSGITSQVGADGTPGATGAIRGIGGWFEGFDTGMIAIQNCPRWMSNLLGQTKASAKTSGATITKPTAFDPKPSRFTVEDPAPTTGTDPDKAPVNVPKLLLDRYAEAVYEQESLKGRQATLTGPLRFDIAPGTSVKVEGVAEAFTALDVTAQAIFGTVLGVSHQWSAENNQAYTSIALGYVRSESENADPAYTSEFHPLWRAQQFYGIGLIDVDW